MNLKFLVVFNIVAFSILNVKGQQINSNAKDSTQTIWQMVKDDAKNTVKGVGNSFTRPLHWKGKDFAKLGILIGGTASLSLADEEIRRTFQSNAEGFPGAVRDFGWYFGSPQNYFLANAGLYGVGLITKNKKIRKTSVLIISSSITTGLIQTFTKNAVGRARPNHRDDPYAFSSFANDAGFRSFPSGHTILSMTMAHSVAKQFKNPWVKVGIYSVGAIPPISRLVDDAHWFTDIVFSTVVSIFVVDAMDKFLSKQDTYGSLKKEKTISWNLRFGGNQIGVVGVF